MQRFFQLLAPPRDPYLINEWPLTIDRWPHFHLFADSCNIFRGDVQSECRVTQSLFAIYTGTTAKNQSLNPSINMALQSKLNVASPSFILNFRITKTSSRLFPQDFSAGDDVLVKSKCFSIYFWLIFQQDEKPKKRGKNFLTIDQPR